MKDESKYELECKICEHSWNSNIIPKMCANRTCRSILWSRGWPDCKLYTNKRFQQKAIRVKYDSECLVAIGNKRRNGKYHSIARDGKKWLLHRWVFFIYNSYLPKNEEIMHICNNTDCINPLHLMAGSHKENEAHKKKCGRTLIGERNPRARLTNEQVLSIKKRLEQFRRGMVKEIANDNVQASTISLIKNGVNWK